MSVDAEPAPGQPADLPDLLVDDGLGALADLQQDVRVLVVRAVLDQPAVGGLVLEQSRASKKQNRPSLI